jgi:hypothetical protein
LCHRQLLAQQEISCRGWVREKQFVFAVGIDPYVAFDEWVDWETHEDWSEGIRLTDQEINPTCDQDEDEKLPVLQYPATSEAD